ncbi:hypothetical protein CH275_10050 [Rhodococcus sp. 06-235-1A]|nr:hypothetical protein CH275_10050 [Rhodococcus sp. 06-235-1A]
MGDSSSSEPSAARHTDLDLTNLSRRSITIVGSAMGSPNELAPLSPPSASNTTSNLPCTRIGPITHSQNAFEGFDKSDRFRKVILDCAPGRGSQDS